MFPSKSPIVAALLPLLAAAPASADPTMHLTAKVLTPLHPGVSQNVQIEVDAQILKLDPDTSFGSVVFGVTFDNAGGSTATHPTASEYLWKPNNPAWTDDLGGGPHQVFQYNFDAGPSSTDLQAVFAAVATDATQDAGSGFFGGDVEDPRLNLALFKPFALGTYEVLWNGVGTATLGFSNVEFAVLDDTTSQFVIPVYSQVTIPNSPPSDFVLKSATLSAPEPNWGLLVMPFVTVAGLLARRRKCLG